MTSSALLVIDVQLNMFDPASPVGSADLLLLRISGLLEFARAAGVPVFFVRNCGEPGDPDQRGLPGWELHPVLQPAGAEPILDKTTSDTFASTSLDDELKARGITHLVIAGLQSEYCIKQTTLGALTRGYQVTLVSDGHSTYPGGGQSALEKSAAINAEFQGRITLAKAADIRFE